MHLGLRRVRGISAAGGCALLAGLSLAGGSVRAQGLPQGGQPGGRPNFESGINAARNVSVTQRLENPVPLDIPFQDESGQTVTLGRYFGKKPVWLVMPFYLCQNTCSQMLHGMVEAHHDPAMTWQVGRDFEIVVVSINPKEDAKLAETTKRRYMSELGIPGAEVGWHFLTGKEANIRRLADSIGYEYAYDTRLDQYAHPSATVLLTPQGKVSRYFFGVVYPGRDLYLGLTEAGKGHIGSPVDQFILMCYHYDPARNAYGLYVVRLLQIFGTATVVLLGSFVALSLRRERKGGPKGPGVREATDKTE